jgi:ribosome-associated protein
MPPVKKNDDLKIAKACAKLALEKKAEDVVILDLRELSGPAMFFLVCSGQSDPQVKAIASSILEGMRQEHQMGPFGYEGRSSSQWIVLDYGIVLVHVMHAEKRKFYRLEELWSDAKRVVVK